MPRELPVGSGLRAEVNEVVSKSVDLVEVRLHLLITAAFFDFLLESPVVLLQRNTNEQNHEKMEKFAAEHSDTDFDTALDSSVASRLAL